LEKKNQINDSADSFSIEKPHPFSACSTLQHLYYLSLSTTQWWLASTLEPFASSSTELEIGHR